MWQAISVFRAIRPQRQRSDKSHTLHIAISPISTRVPKPFFEKTLVWHNPNFRNQAHKLRSYSSLKLQLTGVNTRATSEDSLYNVTIWFVLCKSCKKQQLSMCMPISVRCELRSKEILGL